MKTPENRHKNWNFRQTLIVHLIVGSAVPVFLLAWITTISAGRGVQELYLREAGQVMSQTVSLIEKELQDLLEAYNTIHRFYKNIDVEIEKDSPYLSIEREQNLIHFLKGIESSFNLQNVRLFLSRKEPNLPGPTPRNPSLIAISEYPAHIHETGQKVHPLFTTWLNPYHSELVTRYQKPLSLISLAGPLVARGNAFNPSGRIIVDKRAELIESLLLQGSFRNSFAVLLDTSGNIVSSTSPAKSKLEFLSALKKVNKEGQDIGFQVLNEYYVFRHTFSINSWSLFFAFPRSHAIVQGLKYAQFSILALAVSVLLSFLLVTSFSKYLSKRLNPLITAINVGGITSSILIPKLPIHTADPSHDVIDTLATSYNDMSDRLESLIQKVYNAEHQALHHKLEALQGQMNPHFMYNMLEGIQSNIALDKPEKATRIILELSHYLRIVLSRGEEEIPLREEIQMVKGFLHLVEMVYKKGHSYNITVSERLLSHPIIRFTLQPIVENSIVHGFHSSNSPLEISISCRAEDEKLIIIISDNGSGIDPQRLADLNSHLQSPIPGFNSFGLTNVQTRIRLLYGEEYGLIVESTKNTGTKTIVKYPLNRGVSNG